MVLTWDNANIPTFADTSRLGALGTVVESRIVILDIESSLQVFLVVEFEIESDLEVAHPSFAATFARLLLLPLHNIVDFTNGLFDGIGSFTNVGTSSNRNVLLGALASLTSLGAFGALASL